MSFRLLRKLSTFISILFSLYYNTRSEIVDNKLARTDELLIYHI